MKLEITLFIIIILFSFLLHFLAYMAGVQRGKRMVQKQPTMIYGSSFCQRDRE